VNGTVTGGVQYRDYLFRNAGGRFVDVTPPNIAAVHADHGVQWADFDRDGDEDLALTGGARDGMHHLFRNLLPRDAAGGSLRVLVLDERGRAVRAGAEVRVYTTGTKRLLGTRLIDTGSGYDAQNARPVHIGTGGLEPVDVEVIFPAHGKRTSVRADRVRPSEWSGRALTIRVPMP
jgi:hypothetical protein